MVENVINVNSVFGISPIVNSVLAMDIHKTVIHELANVSDAKNIQPDIIVINALKDSMGTRCLEVQSGVDHAVVQILLHRVTRMPINVNWIHVQMI